MTRERIAGSGNTVVPALLALQSLGYAVRVERSEDREWWWAESDELQLVSDDPLTLLGLATMRRVRGSNWRATDAEIRSANEAFLFLDNDPL